MTSIIVFADPHMVSGGVRIAGIDPAARLAAGIAAVNERHGDADPAPFR